jgi:hypothetical protein
MTKQASTSAGTSASTPASTPRWAMRDEPERDRDMRSFRLAFWAGASVGAGVLVGLVLMLLALGGCGGGDDDGPREADRTVMPVDCASAPGKCT